MRLNISEKYKIRNFELTRNDLLSLDPALLLSLFQERAHHVVEVSLLHILKGSRNPQPNYRNQVKTLFEIWKERGLPTDVTDI